MLDAEKLRFLAEIGFLAARNGRIMAARKIFAALVLARPGQAAPLIGMAMTFYMLDDFAQAEEILRAVLANEPENYLAMAQLALVLTLAGRKAEALPLLRTAADKGGKDSSFAPMVDDLLAECGA